MTHVIDRELKASELDRDLEATRRQVSAMEREEAELHAQQQAEYREWVHQKAERFRYELDRYLAIYHEIKGLEDDWRAAVYAGSEEYCPKLDMAIRSLYGLWAAHADAFEDKCKFCMRHRVANFEDQLDRVLRNKREAVRVLRDWEQPVKSPLPSFRSVNLTGEIAAKFREIVSRGSTT